MANICSPKFAGSEQPQRRKISWRRGLLEARTMRQFSFIHGTWRESARNIAVQWGSRGIHMELKDLLEFYWTMLGITVNSPTKMIIIQCGQAGKCMKKLPANHPQWRFHGNITQGIWGKSCPNYCNFTTSYGSYGPIRSMISRFGKTT